MGFGRIIPALWGDPTGRIISIFLLVYMIIDKIIVPIVKSKNKNETGNPHTDCPFYQDLLNIVEQVLRTNDETSRKIYMIETQITLEEQMKEVEMYLSNIKDNFKTTYLKEMRECNNDDVNGLMDEKDAQHYMTILNDVEEHCKELIRTWVRRNHFSDKSDQDFLVYVDQRFNMVTSHIRTKLDELYQTNCFSISRERLYQINIMHIKTKAQEQFRLLFFRVREISINKKQTIDGLYKQNRDKIKDTINKEEPV